MKKVNKIEEEECDADETSWCRATLLLADRIFNESKFDFSGAVGYFGAVCFETRVQCLAQALTDAEQPQNVVFENWALISRDWEKLTRAANHEQWHLPEENISSCESSLRSDTVGSEKDEEREKFAKELARQINVDVQRSVCHFDVHENLDDEIRGHLRKRLSEISENVIVGGRKSSVGSTTFLIPKSIAEEGDTPGLTESKMSTNQSSKPSSNDTSEGGVSEEIRSVIHDALRLSSASDGHLMWPSHIESVNVRGTKDTGKVGETGREWDVVQSVSIDLEYLQGAHEVVLVILEVGGDLHSDDEIETLSRRILTQRVFTLHSSFPLGVAVHQLLSHTSILLRQFNPQLLKSLILSKHGAQMSDWLGDGSELHFALPWLVTLFAHSVNHFSLLKRIWNVLFALPPPFIVYFLGASIERRSSVLRSEISDSEFGMEAWEWTAEDVEAVLLTSVRWLQAYPFARLHADALGYLSEHRDRHYTWWDAASQWKLTEPFLPASVCPPLWAPCLGNHTLAPAEAGSRAMSVDSYGAWKARTHFANQEWKIARMKQHPHKRKKRPWTTKFIHLFSSS